MQYRKVFILTAIVMMAVSCNLFTGKSYTDNVVAKVGNHKLYHSELSRVYPGHLKGADSIAFAQNFIEKWVKNKLLYDKAMQYLNNEDKAYIENMIDNYRTSLANHKYQQLLLLQKLDTVIGKEEVEDYYKKNAGNFRLDTQVVKAIYIKLSKSSYDTEKVRTWIKSGKEDDLIKLEDYCYQNARNFQMGNNWTYIQDLMDVFPKKILNIDNFLNYTKYAEVQDSLYQYFINITDFKLKNDTLPMTFAEGKIREILLNKKKFKFIKDLENNIYNDAVNQKAFTININ